MDNLEELRKHFTYSNDFIKFKGGRLKMWLRQSSLVQTIYYGLRLDILSHKFSKSWDNSITQAFALYLSEEENRNSDLINYLRKDINDCYKINKAKPYEYFLFGLRHADSSTRKKYITDISMLYLLTKSGTRKLHDLELNDKYNFYLLCGKYFQRKVVSINSFDDYLLFEDLALSSKKVIVKPVSMGCGGGIFVSQITSVEESQKVFQKIMHYGGNWIAEEYIHQSDQMSVWNPSSVNTIRYTTFLDSNGIHPHLPFIRTGRKGAVVDNGGRGGIYAVINLENGKIMSNGFDEVGKEYLSHPDSNICYLGWQVPRWQELKDLASEIHLKIMPRHKYIGWDFALTDNGWVLIEGNWGQYVCQQSCTKIGYKHIFEKYLFNHNESS